MSEGLILFLDANTLVSPVTRTLVIPGARADGLRWTWSAHVEKEADGHARGTATRTSTVRKEILKTELSPTATSTGGLKTEATSDRRVIADAIHAGSRYLITADVDDFAFDDLAAHEMSAVNPNYFMALRSPSPRTGKASVCWPRCRTIRRAPRPRCTRCLAAATRA